MFLTRTEDGNHVCALQSACNYVVIKMLFEYIIKSIITNKSGKKGLIHEIPLRCVDDISFFIKMSPIQEKNKEIMQQHLVIQHCQSFYAGFTEKT